ncbi:protease SohB [Cellvibrio japonicus]|uniref:Possible protease SohB n=1 Tax=Cellvibrio japonicus (strain Ueda107) TaxID=498211 RepID=B3PHP3_CELJU|nr:protease SohB [Cellvibrio japonicus]ACE82868.1 possible protease SohB [Cellvibrio japonicus Ueda107]QEI12511.1 protease SohB [Cellvibrio japonicus]QEI16085.1 protease SohB [Cellvibrio japonicus]QEI19663.1 protease SohB [Cellvibrio japonicus]
MEFLAEYGLFLAKTVTFVVAVFVIISLAVSLGGRNKKSDKGQIEVIKLNEKYEQMRDALRDAMMDEEAYKAFEKAEKKRLKEEKAQKKKAAKTTAKPAEDTVDSGAGHAEAPEKKRVFVLDFYGDIKASACDNLREEITTVLSIAKPTDEVVVKVESGGGMVHGYGLASSQLARITHKHIPLTVCVDKVAASGGYMMACVANKIVAAPFAIVGSIGVIAQLPNFHKLLKKNDIDFEMFTAGEFKRTVTMFGENTEKGRAKFVEELEDTHVLFKEFVGEHRPQVDIAKVATGEVWFGRRAKDVNLIDELQTSDEYLLSQVDQADIYTVEFTFKKTLPEKLGLAAQGAVDRLLMTWWERLNLNRWF